MSSAALVMLFWTSRSMRAAMSRARNWQRSRALIRVGLVAVGVEHVTVAGVAIQDDVDASGESWFTSHVCSIRAYANAHHNRIRATTCPLMTSQDPQWVHR